MRIRISILKFLAVFFISGICSADNSQFHKPEYEKQLEQQEPVFETNNLMEAIEYTCVDITRNVPLQTPGYIHYQSPDNHHSVIFHKIRTLVFVRMGDINVKAYIVKGLVIDKDNAWWSVYEIDTEEDCLHTRLYKEMIEELKVIYKGCFRKKEDFI